MILTCPNCATRYFVDDDEVQSEGRKVRCEACRTAWIAGTDSPAPDSAPLFPASRAARRVKGNFRPLIALVAILAPLVVAAFVFQGAVIKAWPGAAAVYEAVGLGHPVATHG